MFEQRLLILPGAGDDYFSGGLAPRSTGSSAFVPALPRAVQARSINPARVGRHAGARTARRDTSAAAFSAMVPSLALLHLVLGSLGIVCGILLWYVLDPANHLSPLIGGDALLLAVCACAAFLASGTKSHRGKVCARVLLVAADLVVGAGALGLLSGMGGAPWLAALGYPLAVLLFVAPLLAMTLFSPRAGVVVLVVGMALIPLAMLARVGMPSLTSFSGEALGSALRQAASAPWGTALGEESALAVGGGLAIWCWWAAQRSTALAFAAFTESLALAQARENALETERAGLGETIHRQAEEQTRTHLRLMDLCRQVSALAAIAERIAAGDLSATHHLDPTLQEPLASLAAALGMAAQRVASTTSNQARARQGLAEKLATALEDQRETLTALERAVRAGSYDAEALAVALAQVDASGAASYPGVAAADVQASTGAVAGEERRHLAGHLAEETKHSVAWIAHLHGCQAEMEQTMRQLTRLLTSPSEPSVDDADTLALGASDLRRVMANRWANSAVVARAAER